MLIFWKERLVFLANTKIGSTSIEAALEPLSHVVISRPPQLKHIPARSFNRHLRPLLNHAASGSFTTVAVMREPIDWLGSWYRYRMREIEESDQSTAGMDFAGFIEAYLSPEPPRFAAVGTQSGFLCDPNGFLLVDRVFRYEALTSFVHFLEDTLGCEITLPHMNVSPKAPMTLPEDLRRRAMKVLANDYAIYNSLPG